MKTCQANKFSEEQKEQNDNTTRPDFAHLRLLKEDCLYHIDIQVSNHNLEETFGDVRFVCMGGAEKRMELFANYIANEIGYKLPLGAKLTNICKDAGRYALFKVGPVLSVSHGMGAPSIGILLNELIKLTFYAKCKDPVFFRMGTSGGFGLEPGTVVITEAAVDGMFNSYYENIVLGSMRKYDATFDKDLVQELLCLASSDDKFNIVSGLTMTANDFYESQGRLNGPFCDFTLEEKTTYLKQLQERQIKNVEMELLAFGALTHRAGIRAAGVCVTLLDRFQGDQIAASKEVLEEWDKRPQALVARYIRNQLGIGKGDN